MPVVLIPVMLLAIALAVVVSAGPYTPPPRLAWLRSAVTVFAGATVVLMAVAVERTWWIQYPMENTMDAAAVVSRGDRGVALAIIVAGVTTAMLAAAGAWGRRNWAPLGLVVLWPVLGYGWLLANNQVTSSRVSGEPGAGLWLGTLAALLVTAATMAGVVHRSISVRSAR